MNICDKEIRVSGRILRVARLADEGYEFIEQPEAAIAALRESRNRVDLFTFMPRLAKATLKERYATEWDNLAVLRVTTFEDWWNQIGFKTRNRARLAAKKGVIIREVTFDDALAEGIRRIYNESPVRQGRRFKHYGKGFETVRAMSGTFLKRSVFIAAFLGEELVGFLKFTIDESHSQAGIMSILSLIKHRDKSINNALLAQAVRSCAERGVGHLVYSKFEFGKQQDSLRDFKESNGFQRVDMPRYYVPMTWLGRQALQMGLHRGLRQYIPATLLAKAFEARASWYKRKFSPGRLAEAFGQRVAMPSPRNSKS